MADKEDKDKGKDKDKDTAWSIPGHEPPRDRKPEEKREKPVLPDLTDPSLSRDPILGRGISRVPLYLPRPMIAKTAALLATRYPARRSDDVFIDWIIERIDTELAELAELESPPTAEYREADDRAADEARAKEEKDRKRGRRRVPGR